MYKVKIKGINVEVREEYFVKIFEEYEEFAENVHECSQHCPMGNSRGLHLHNSPEWKKRLCDYLGSRGFCFCDLFIELRSYSLYGLCPCPQYGEDAFRRLHKALRRVRPKVERMKNNFKENQLPT